MQKSRVSVISNNPVVGDSNFDSVPPPGELDETKVVFHFGPLAQLCENMTSPTKPEVHKTLHCRQTRTKPRSRVTCAENFVKFGHVFLDMQADKLTDIERDIKTR